MKSIKHIVLGAFLTLSAFSAVLYTSCGKDACKDVVCNNGGTCTDGLCTCPTGFIGTNCETRAFVGSWKGSDVWSQSGNYPNITISLANSSTTASNVIITNPGGFGSTVTVTGTLSADGKTITYTSQPVSSSVNISGTMTLTDNTHFTHSYTAVDATSTATCSGNYTKQ
jgi:hypothetical protein